MYALLSLGGLYHLISGASNVAVLWFALSGCARSNGVLNAGYLCFQTMHQAYDAVFLQKRAHVSIFYSYRHFLLGSGVSACLYKNVSVG